MATSKINAKQTVTTKAIHALKQHHDHRSIVRSYSISTLPSQANTSKEIYKILVLDELLKHIPPQIIDLVKEDITLDESDKILLFIDVSGFTAITEKYTSRDRPGIDDLTTELNNYMSKIIDHILRNGGEVIKFAGDAILSSWTEREDGALRALRCAIEIQKNCSRYCVKAPTSESEQELDNYVGKDGNPTSVVDDDDDDEDYDEEDNDDVYSCSDRISNSNIAYSYSSIPVELNVKVILTHGKTETMILETNKHSFYLIVGDAIEQIKDLESLSEVHHLVISKQFWNRLPKDIQSRFEKNFSKYSSEKCFKLPVLKYHKIDDRAYRSSSFMDSARNSSDISTMESVEILEKLSRFVMDSVYDKITSLEPFCYTSEMRHVSIAFINIDINMPEMEDRKKILNEILNQVDSVSRTNGGVLSKVIGFDKALSFLCIFGLVEKENKAADALNAADELIKWLPDVDESINHVSAGVATGLTYCGILGHFYRHEYSAIGSKVNYSARLMCAYPNVVSCDEASAASSRLPRHFFQNLPFKKLKGIRRTGTALKFNSTASSTPKAILDIEKCKNFGNFVGRRVDVMLAASFITNAIEGFNVSKRSFLIYRGEYGSGRTTLLSYIYATIQRNQNSLKVICMRCIACTTALYSGPSYTSVSTIIMKLLDVDNLNDDSKNKLQRCLVANYKLDEFTKLLLCELLGVANCWTSTRCKAKNQRKKMAEVGSAFKEAYCKLLEILLDYSKHRLLVILMDDMHCLDYGSLEVLSAINKHRCVVIGTCSSGSHLNKVIELLSAKLIVRPIAPLGEDHMKFLIGEMLKVTAIQKSFLKVMHERSQGMPGVCKDAIHELQRTDMIGVCKKWTLFDVDAIEKNHVQSRPKIMMKKNMLVEMFFDRSNFKASNDRAGSCLVCTTCEPRNLDIPTSVESSFLRQYDRLNAFQKTVMNNCAVLGPSFSRQYLFGMCRGNVTTENFNTSLKFLIDYQMISCACNRNHETTKCGIILCMCSSNTSHLPAMCKMFRVTHESIRTIVLQGMTKQTTAYRRQNTIEWLETQLPGITPSGVYWKICATEGGMKIFLPESCLSMRTSTSEMPSVTGVFALMKMKCLEKGMKVGNPEAAIEFHSQKNDHLGPLTPIPHTSWNCMEDNLFRCPIDGLDINIKVLNAERVDMPDGSKVSLKLVHIFDLLHIAEQKFQMPFESINSFLQPPHPHQVQPSLPGAGNALPTISGNEVNSRRTSVWSTVSTESSENTPLCNCDCDEQILLLLKELLSYSRKVGDRQRILFYALGLARFYISRGVVLSATQIIEQIEAMKTDNDMLHALQYYICACYQYKIANHSEKAIEYLYKSLEYLSPIKHVTRYVPRYSYSNQPTSQHSWPNRTNSCISDLILSEEKNDSTDSSINLCQSVLSLIYRIIARGWQDDKTKQRLAKIAWDLEMLEKSVSGQTTKIATFLVLAEELYRQVIDKQVCKRGKAFCFGYTKIVNFISRTLRSAKMNHLESPASTCRLCSSYVGLEWGRDLDDALNNAVLAFDTYKRLVLVDYCIICLPYLCIAAIYADRLDVVSERLDSMEALLSTHCGGEANNSSLELALRNALLLDLNYDYGLCDTDGLVYKDKHVMMTHIHLLGTELLALEDQASNHSDAEKFDDECEGYNWGVIENDKHSMSWLMYCFAICSRGYFRDLQFDRGLPFLKLAVKIINSHIGRMTLLDPLTQRGLLAVIESQLLLHVNCLSVVTYRGHPETNVEMKPNYHMRPNFPSIMNATTFIHEDSVNYPFFCLLVAYRTRLLGCHSLGGKDVKIWLRKAVSSAECLGSNNETKKLQMCTKRWGMNTCG